MIDDGDPTPCVTGISYAGLSEGSHLFRVFATDSSGNPDVSPAVWSWTVDTIAPVSILTTVPPSTSSSTQGTFEFFADEEATFQCWLDDGPIEECRSGHTVTNLSDGQHVLNLQATDRAGNLEEVPQTHAWTVDTTAPEVSVDVSGAHVYGTSTSELGIDTPWPLVLGWMRVEAVASDGISGIRSVSFSVDGDQVEGTYDQAKNVWWFDFRPRDYWWHTVKVTATNGSGLTAEDSATVFSGSDSTSSRLL